LPDIFISYSHVDKDVAERFASGFQAAGFDVWWDIAIRSGESFDTVIEAAIKSSKAVVVLWSPSSVASRWVRSEATLADRNNLLLPVMIQNCERPIMFELTQTSDLSQWHGDVNDKLWTAFVGEVKDFIARGTKGAARDTRPQDVLIAVSNKTLALPDKPSIAVLPFVNMSGDVDQDYFADGMVDEITTALTHFNSLFVIGNSSTLAFRGEARNHRAIAQELGVRYLLEGSVRKSGKRVRISVELMDAVDNLPIWSNRFDGLLEDVFDLQDEVAGAVASHIEPTIEAAEVRRTTIRRTEDLGAYDLFLRALVHIRSWELVKINEAIDFLNEAIARDPEYALALAAACTCHAQLFLGGWSEKPVETHRVGLDLGQRALRYGSDNPQVIGWVAVALLTFGDDVEAINGIAERSIARHPGTAFLCATSGFLKAVLGLPELGLKRFETAMRLDPRSAYLPFNLLGTGIALFALRRFEEAIPMFTETAHLLPNHPLPHPYLAASYAHLGRHEEARAHLKAIGPAFYARIGASPYAPALVTLLRDGVALAAGQA